MRNREVYEKDPRTHTLLNQGVAKVTTGESEAELETLRYELTNFVCNGQYAAGLIRILTAYFAHLDKSEQPGVWVSGFFGSGKSMLVKMLQYLWLNYVFPDGATARGLAKLPTDVKDLLRDLSTAAKRMGGLHAAAGTLGAGAGDSVRLELLGILFKSVGLPEQIARASFVMWLREEGIYDAVRQQVQQAGGDFDKALVDLYVSDKLAQAILSVRPDFAHKPADVKLLLQKQFPKVSEISVDDMITKIKQALGGKKGKIPCTLIVLDEVQQYIGESADRSKAVQDVQEQCCSRLGANVMFVATGQNAITSVGLLQRLQGRFPMPVELQDTDVEQVTREVVLKKKSTAIAGLQKVLEDRSGEIERQLASSKIAFNTRDRQLLVQDYPILPVRRRFWERVLRAVDKAGTGAQLRTQLWIVYDAVKQTAELPVGNVVSASFLFEHIKTKVLQSGVLLQEISETIARQKHETDGELRYQLCALTFLIGQLPHDGPADAGIRANAETLADLLVTDLNSSSAEIRKKVPELLEQLVASGAIMQVEHEYRMQTREGSEWNQAYHEVRNKLLADPGKLASERSQLLKTQCSEALKKSKLVHGLCKEARRFELHFGAEAPDTSGATVPVWIRDGWEIQEKTVVNDARAAGDSAAVVYGFVPQKQAEELKQAIASHYAATTTLQAKGAPSTPEGIEARKAMETRQEQALRTRDTIISDILNDTAVYLAGGDPVNGMLLETKVQDAARLCLDRLFPQFHQADSPDWHKVIDRSKKGDGDALDAVGHKGDPQHHSVCKAVVDYVGTSKKGTDVRKHFAGPPCGWPQDAVDAALIVLTNAGVLQARSGTEVIPQRKLDQKSIAVAEFRREFVPPPPTPEMVKIRALYKSLGLNTNTGQESAHAPEFLSRLTRLAQEAGGEPPAPKCPDTKHLAELANRLGNDQLNGISADRERLAKEIAAWQKRQALIAEREPRWRQLKRLLAHAVDLPVAKEVEPEVKAIEDQRRLLDEPDPLPGMVDKLTEALRRALNEAHAACTAAHEQGLSGLEATETWQQLTPEQRYETLSKHSVRQMPAIAVGTTDEVLATLQKTKVSELQAICDALPTRFGNASAAAVKRLEPQAQSVSLPSSTIKNDDDLKTWLTTAEARIREKLKEGPVIV